MSMTYYIRKRYKESLLLLVIIICSVLLKLKAAFLTADAFNALMAADTSLFITHVIWCGVLFFLFAILLAFQTWYEVFVRQKILADIRQGITQAYAQYPPHRSADYSSGKMVSWLTTDINRISSEGYQCLYNVISAVIEVSLSLLALCYVNWLLMLSIVVLALFNLWLPKLVDRKMAESFQSLTLQQENFTANITNLFKGFTALFSLNQSSFLRKKANEDIQVMRLAENQTYKTVGLAIFLAAVGNILGQIGSLIVSGFFVAWHMITFGAILSVGTISSNIFNGVSNLSSNIISVKGVLPIFEKHQHFFKLVADYQKEEGQKVNDSQLRSNLTLDKVSLAFDAHPILSEASYTFEKGKKYCLIGPSGSGKTTIFKLLNGSLAYDSGQITLDGQPITAIQGARLRSQITYVDQTPYLFKGSIRDNVLLGNQVKEEELYQVLDKVGLRAEIERLPQGLETLVGEGGLSLSGGQTQRLALARALLNGSRFLLLDESTSSLDQKLAKSIEKQLLRDSSYSLLVITHHLSEDLAVYFDDILQLNQGKLLSTKEGTV